MHICEGTSVGLCVTVRLKKKVTMKTFKSARGRARTHRKTSVCENMRRRVLDGPACLTAKEKKRRNLCFSARPSTRCGFGTVQTCGRLALSESLEWQNGHLPASVDFVVSTTISVKVCSYSFSLPSFSIIIWRWLHPFIIKITNLRWLLLFIYLFLPIMGFKLTSVRTMVSPFLLNTNVIIKGRRK